MTQDEALDGWLADMWAQAPNTFTVAVEGATIACRSWNLGAGDLPGIVLVHGFLGHAQWWDHIAPALAGDHRVVALNLSGMGDSDRRATYSRAQHGREILAVAEAVGMARPIVIAHSYGAIASLIAARATPDAVRRIIVLDSGLPAPDEIREAMPARPERIYPDRETMLARFRLMPPGGWPHPKILSYIAETSVVARPYGGWTWKFDAAMADILRKEAFRPALTGVTTPCDLVYGDRSEVFTAKRRAYAREIVANCTPFIALPACHHHLMVEQPIALLAVLQGLLARADAA